MNQPATVQSNDNQCAHEARLTQEEVTVAIRLLEALEDKLEPVLAHRPPTGKADPQPQCCLVPLAETMRGNRLHLTEVNQRIDSILNRIRI